MNLAFYSLLFVLVGAVFILVHLVAGKFIRPNRPGAEKATIYECGEPTIGSAWIQFDLRFYVVALLFVIFDVEVAFFFPWAEVFGRANDVAAAPKPADAAGYRDYAATVLAASTVQSAGPTNRPRRQDYERLAAMTPEEMGLFDKRLRGLTPEEKRQLDERLRGLTTEEVQQLDPPERLQHARARVEDAVNGNREKAIALSWMAFIEILVFFGVLLVGFAYLWRRGDLAWVRSTAAERPAAAPPAPAAAPAAPAARVMTGAGGS
jgi:NADH-quinone oxidoreductase subunit A